MHYKVKNHSGHLWGERLFTFILHFSVLLEFSGYVVSVTSFLMSKGIVL